MKSLMLAATVAKENLEAVKLPVYGSYKYDGVRAFVSKGCVLSRSMKPIKNKYVQSVLGLPKYEGLDGELIVGSPTSPQVFKTTTSQVNSIAGEPDVKFYVFDSVDDGRKPFFRRYQAFKTVQNSLLHVVQQDLLTSYEALCNFEAAAVAEGYEGIMLRSPDGRYKYGRSTLNEHYLLKVKRFDDSEAVITGFQELMHNGNELQVLETGRKERSHRKEGMRGSGTLGSLEVLGINGRYKDVAFCIGSGFDSKMRQQVWDNKHLYLNRVVKYKHFDVGADKAPRFPIYLGLRDPDDL